MRLPDVDGVGLVKTQKEFSDGLTMDLTDEEISKSMRIVVEIQNKWADRPNTVNNLEALRDEVLTRLANDCGVLATLDPAPALYGEPPVLEFIGKVAGDSSHQYGMDHEKKMYEVRKATERGEAYLGQKETPDSAKAKRRNKS